MASYDSQTAPAGSDAPAADAVTTGAGLSWRHLQQLDSLALSSSQGSAASSSATTALSSSAPNPGSAAHHLLLHRGGAGGHHHHHHYPGVDDDARSVGSRLSNAGSTYSAATFYSFSTSNYSGFAGAGELARHRDARGQKRHYVHPQDLDPNAMYDVDWVQDDAANACMACFAEFSALLRRKHHCRACGRVVCSTCLRHRLPVTGLRGLQKACDDCARVHSATNKRGGDEGEEGSVGAAGLGASGSGVAMMRGACESISEDTETTPRHSPAALPNSTLPKGGRGHGERKVEGEKQSEEGELLLASLDGAASAAQLHHHRRRLSQGKEVLKPHKEEAADGIEEEEPFPTAASKKGKRRAASGLGYLAVAAAGTAVAVGSVLVMRRNPELVASVVAQVKAGVAAAGAAAAGAAAAGAAAAGAAAGRRR